MDDQERDERLLERVRQGDDSALEEFVAEYGDRIYGFAMHVCHDTENARDVAQETLLQSLRSLGTVKDAGALKTWLFRVATNACRMKHRKSKFEPSRMLSLEELMPANVESATFEIPDSSSLPDEEVARHEARDAVREAIDQLPEGFRVVLVLRDLEQLSTRQTAEITGLTETAVKMRLHRARLMIRKLIEARLRGHRRPETTA